MNCQCLKDLATLPTGLLSQTPLLIPVLQKPPQTRLI